MKWTLWLLVSFFQSAMGSYLYRDDPESASAVTEYTDSQGLFEQSTHPRVVEFYSPFCGGCKVFKPKYVEMARTLRLAYPQVEFYAVSCSAHKAKCHEYKIRATPTLLVFPEHATEGTRVMTHTAEELVKALDVSPRPARKLQDEEDQDEDEDENVQDEDEEDEQEEGEDNALEPENDLEDEDEAPPRVQRAVDYPKNGEDDEEEEDTDQNDLYQDEDEQDEEEEEEDEDGNDNSSWRVQNKGAVAARLRPRDMDRWQEVLRERLIAKRHQEARKRFRRNKSNKLLPDNAQIQPGATSTMRAHTPGTQEFEMHKRAVQARLEKLRKKHRYRKRRESDESRRDYQFQDRSGRLAYRKEVSKQRVVERLPITRHFVSMSEEEELILDCSLAFIHTMKFGIFTSFSELSLEKKRALRGWLDLLAVSLPPEWGLHNIIDDIRGNFDFATKSDRNMHEIIDRHNLPRKAYSKGCSKGKWFCGYWKLIHVMSVGVAEHKGGRNLIDMGLLKSSAPVFSPMAAANTLRNYISHFFPCEQCKRNFVDAYDNCDNNRRCDRLTEETYAATEADWKELSMWLWEFHNDVNVRLLNEKAQKVRSALQKNTWLTAEAGPAAAGYHNEIEVLWPNLDLCISCFNSDGTWNEDAVFVVLEKTYWPDSSSDPKADRLLQFEDVEPAGPRITLLLLFVGLFLAYQMRQSLSKYGLQKTVYMAKTIAAPVRMNDEKRKV